MRAGCLLLGASFFSDLDVELGLGNVDEFVVRFRLDLRFCQLRPQSLEFSLEFLNILGKFLGRNLRRRSRRRLEKSHAYFPIIAFGQLLALSQVFSPKTGEAGTMA